MSLEYQYSKVWLMPTLIDLAWLIPFIPCLGAILIAILLVSFTRTMNRLSKPVAFILFSLTSRLFYRQIQLHNALDNKHCYSIRNGLLAQQVIPKGIICYFFCLCRFNRFLSSNYSNKLLCKESINGSYYIATLM